MSTIDSSVKCEKKNCSQFSANCKLQTARVQFFYKMVSYFCMKFKKVWYWKFNKIFDLSKSKAFHKTFLKVRLKNMEGREGGGSNYR